MIELHLSHINKTVNVPTSWHEIPQSKLHYTLRLLFTTSDKEMFYCHFLLFITGLKVENFIKINWFNLFFKAEKPSISNFCTVQLLEISEKLSFFFDKESFFVDTPFTTFTKNGIRYAFPYISLREISGKTLENIDVLINAYKLTNDKKLMAKCVAELYYPTHFLCFKLPKFILPFIAKEILLDDLDNNIIILWYNNIKRYYYNQAPDIFSFYEESENINIDMESWRKILRALAGEKRGSVENVREKMNMDEIFFELRMLNQEREKIEKKYKSLTND